MILENIDEAVKIRGWLQSVQREIEVLEKSTTYYDSALKLCRKDGEKVTETGRLNINISFDIFKRLAMENLKAKEKEYLAQIKQL